MIGNATTTTKTDLYLEYARVLTMCEGTEVPPYKCVRVDNKIKGWKVLDRAPYLGGGPGSYSFAVGILDNDAIFRDTPVYRSYTGRRIVLADKTEVELAHLFTFDTGLMTLAVPPGGETVTFRRVPGPLRRPKAGEYVRRYEGHRGFHLCVTPACWTDVGETWEMENKNAVNTSNK